MHALCRLVFLLGLPLATAAAAQAQGAAVPLGSFEPATGATDGKADCPGAGGFDDLVYALLYQLPGDDYVVNMYRRPGDGDAVSILVSKQQSCIFRRMEFHSPARPQPALQAMPQPAPLPVPR
ncbi:MAG TPA: hypothetical protein VF930_12765 [Stellaceae bacterium]